MLSSLLDFENYAHLWVKAVNIERRKIGFGIKDEPVGSCQQRLLEQEEWLNSTIFIGPCMAQLTPALICVLHFEIDGNSAGRCAARRIEDVCRDGAHVGVSPTVSFKTISN